MTCLVGTLSSVAAAGLEAMAKAKEGTESVTRVVSVIRDWLARYLPAQR